MAQGPAEVTEGTPPDKKEAGGELFALHLKGPAFLSRWLERMLCLDRLDALYASLQPGDPASFPRRTLEAMGVELVVSSEDRERIPKEGPLVVVANHPFGALDGLLIADLMESVRSDVRIIANRLLGRIPEMNDRFFAVDVFGGEHAARTNLTPLRKALRWVREGHVLVMFPAGEVSSVGFKRRRVEDPPWTETAGALARRGGAKVLPVRFVGSNRPLFHLAGLVHPRLRTALLPREFLAKEGCSVEVRVAHAIPPNKLPLTGTDAELTRYLRHRVDLLHSRHLPTAEAPSAEEGAPLISSQPATRLQEEYAGLGAESRLGRASGLEVSVTTAERAPTIMKELGRLREETFREVGEGTGLAVDIDRHDNDYIHLVLWDLGKQRIAGSYRLGCTDRILREQGPEGLYTTTLFHIRPEFFNRMGPALELGRSFICKDYQRGFGPLMLLWKGIGRFVLKHPHYRYLFGPVSISSRYSKVGRGLIVRWLQKHAAADDFAHLVRPRKPLRVDRASRRQIRAIHEEIDTIDELSSAVSDIEFTHRGVPVLVREYLKLGGRFAGFNRDPDFSDVFDGLVMVDLFQTPRRTLDRYMGREGAQAFLDYHASAHGVLLPRWNPANPST